MHANLNTAFFDETQDALDAARVAVETLIILSKASTALALRDEFDHYLEQSRNHTHRLETVLRSRREEPREQACHAARGLKRTVESLPERYSDSTTLDATLINAAQKLVHYQIASYGTLCEWAKTLENEDALQRLKPCLSEAKGADEQLKRIAQEFANADAA